MRYSALLLFVFSAGISFSQEDQFQITGDVSIGTIQFTSDEIVNSGYSFSSESWNPDEVVHSTVYGHQTTINNSVLAMVHGGISVPVLKFKSVSIGVRPKVGVGSLFTPDDPVVETNFYNTEGNVSKISSFSLDASAVLYMRYKINFNSHVLLFGGVRHLNSYYDYNTPVFGAEFGQKQWSISVSGYVTTINYYRELSNGTQEIAKSSKELGAITFHYFFAPKISR